MKPASERAIRIALVLPIVVLFVLALAITPLPHHGAPGPQLAVLWVLGPMCLVVEAFAVRAALRRGAGSMPRTGTNAVLVAIGVLLLALAGAGALLALR